MKLEEIEGIGEKYAKSLKKADIKTLKDLMKLDRDQLIDASVKANVSVLLLDTWQEHADLMRIKGVGPEYAEALNEIGIDSVAEFKLRNPDSTYKKLETLQKKKPRIFRRMPSKADVKDWIKQAVALETKEQKGPKLTVIEGIGLGYAKALRKVGLVYVKDLMGLDRGDIKDIAKTTKVSPRLIDKWQEMADLMRIDGVGAEYAEALNEIGIDSVSELKMRNAANTMEKIIAMDKRKPNLIRKLPREADIAKWIKQAKEL